MVELSSLDRSGGASRAVMILVGVEQHCIFASLVWMSFCVADAAVANL